VIAGHFKDHKKDIIAIIQRLLNEMTMAFSYLNLDEEQEEYLSGIFNGSMARVTGLFARSVELDRKFDKVIEDIHRTVTPHPDDSNNSKQ
jgi:hypothetical protein